MRSLIRLKTWGLMLLAEYALIKDMAAEILEGGAGSGNWGHKGRPGHRGGSLGGGGGGGISAHVAGGERRIYSRDMAIAIKRKKIGSADQAMEFIKKKFPGQPEDRYARALQKADLSQAVSKKAGMSLAQVEKNLQTGAISNTKALGGGITETFVMDVDGVKGVFKKMSNRAKQEATAYQIDKALGFGVVPPVVMRKVNVGKGEEQGSIMHFVEGMTAAKHSGKFKYDDMAKITAFDFIIGNQDRHPANVIVDKGGKSWAIDNAFAFGKAKNIVSMTIPMVEGKPIPASVKAGIQKMLSVRPTMEKKIGEMLGNKAYAKALFDRATELSKMTNFPKERFTWHKTWTEKHGYTPDKVRGLVEVLWLRRLLSTSMTLQRTRMLPLGL
jgi:hypothetical protein